MAEGVEAAKEVVYALVKVIEHDSSRSGMGDTMRDLQHAAQLFRSSQLRLASLEARISSITDLVSTDILSHDKRCEIIEMVTNCIHKSFNIVTQRDSRQMGQDSRSMHTIAVMTLVFLPGTLIATIFGSNLFDFGLDDKDGVAKLRVSKLFWIFWAVSLPFTAIVIVLWLWLMKVGIKRSVHVAV